MTIRIGANPIGWSNDDDRSLGGEISLEQCLTEARVAGYEGMELGHKFPREPAALRKVLSAHTLDLVSGWYSSGLLTHGADVEIAALQSHLTLLRALDSKVMVFAETTGSIHGDSAMPISRRPVLAPDAWADFGRRVTAVADYLQDQGMRMAYHHHMGTVVQSAADIDALMAHAGSAVGLLLDTGHATFSGADPVALARRYHDRIAHVHCKDVRPDVMDRVKAADMSFLAAVKEGVFTVPGDGCVDFVGVFRELPNYSGWLVVEAEQDPQKAHPLTYARLGHSNLTRFAAEGGLA